MNLENNDRKCWVSETEKIISFHAVPDYTPYEFNSRELLLNFVMVTKGGQGYRIQ